MAVHSILQNSAFDPEKVALLGAAYALALRALGTTTPVDPDRAEAIARKIIEIGQTGERDPAQICRIVLHDLALSPR